MTKPHINVTPLIDVLLVLLIIFMVVAPMKPSAFRTRLPAEQPDTRGTPHPDTLIVNIGNDGTLALNGETKLGDVNDSAPMISRLQAVFRDRTANGSVSSATADDIERPYADKTERTVFIKAPRSLNFGAVARVVDAVKSAGAYPIGLQIDRLD